MGFFASLKNAVRSAVDAVVKLGKAALRVVRELGKAAVETATAAARKVARAIEDLARKVQGKQSVELERICRQLERILVRVQELRVPREGVDFHTWARLVVLETLAPTLAELANAAKSASTLARDVILFAEQGLTLVDDPASATSALLDSVARLTETHAGASVDSIALKRLVTLLEGMREVNEQRVEMLQRDLFDRKLARNEAVQWAKLKQVPFAEEAHFADEIRRLESAISVSQLRLEDAEMVCWTGAGLHQCAIDPSVRELFGEELGVIEEITFGFYAAGEDAVLDSDQRMRLHEAAVIFRGDASRVAEESAQQVSVGL